MESKDKEKKDITEEKKAGSTSDVDILEESAGEDNEKEPVEKSPKPEAVITNGTGEEVTKLLLGEDDELSFAVEKIKEVATRRVVLSIPDGSDLLVSSVGMKLLAQRADEMEKTLVVVSADSSGLMMARSAGIGTATTIGDVDENVWEKAESARSARAAVAEEAEVKEHGVLVNKDFMDNIEETESGGSSAEEAALDPEAVDVQDEPEPVTPMDLGRPRQKIDLESDEEKEETADDAKGIIAPVVGEQVEAAAEEPIAQKDISSVSEGDFTMTIDKGSKVAGGSALKRVMPSTAGGADKRSGLIGRDFSAYEMGSAPPSESPDAVPVATESPKKKSGNIAGKIGGFFAKIPAKIPFLAAKPATTAAKWQLKKLMIPVVVVLGLAVAGGYWYLPEVVVSLEVESIAVEFEGDVTAKVSADDIDNENRIIPARSEVQTNNGSESTAATGIASRGEKASGNVIIVNKTEEERTIPSGTVLTNGGLGFVLQADVVIPPRISEDFWTQETGSVVAQEIGTEYNLVSGTTLAVGGAPLSDLAATNPSAFTGGTQEDYAVVSQADIDTLADSIKKKLFDESEKELEEAFEDTKWTYVEESLKNELDGDVSSDVPAGAEEPEVNVDVKTKSTALYYDSDSLDELIKDLLMEDVGEEDLENIELSDNMELEISVKSASVDNGTVVLSLKVSGFIMPLLDEDEVERNLYGKGWAEGIGYLKQVDYVSGDPEVDFYPEWFPEFARRMPSRKGQITVNIKNIVPEEEEAVEEDAEDAS